FNLINPTDPVSQDEWAKQNAVKSIRPKIKINKEGVLDDSIPKDTLHSIALKESGKAHSKHKIHNIFWSIVGQVKSLISVLFLLVLTKLTNRYMDGEILLPRSFKLFSFLGLILILKEVFTFVVGFVNMLIMQHPNFHITQIPNGLKYDLNTSLSFTNTGSLSNFGIGLLIILLAQVLKQAIFIKQEQDLTI
ncbi:MAG: DUF2975 domain-containing protein, partial [Pedobacter sp.]